MKKQEMLVTAVKDGQTVTFERFVQKSVKAVLSQYKKVGRTGLGELFWKDYESADYIEFTRTPDCNGVNDYPVARYTAAEFLAACGIAE